MSRFQAQKGFTHFVFANHKDSYLLPNLVRLELNSYLYCQLKDQGYEAVYFISGMEGEYTLSLFDQPSRELFQKYGKKSKGFMGLFGGEDSDEARLYHLPGGAECARRFNAMLKKGRRQAFVFHPDTFREIFEKQPQELEEFSRVGQRYLDQNENILVLQMPMAASVSLPLLTDPKGIFAQQGEQELCPEVGMLLRQEHSVKLYEQLQKDMGDRLVIFSSFSYEQMLLAARWVYLTNHLDWEWQEQDVKDLAVFLYTWYASPILRRETGPILSENEDRKFSLLLRELTNSTTWWSLKRAIASLKEKAGNKALKHYLRRTYRPELAGPWIRSDSLLARKIKQIRLPDSLYGSMPELGRSMIARFYDVAQEYQTPRSRPVCPELEKILMQCLSCLENAVSRGDTTTFERAVKVLGYSVNRKFAYEEDEKRVLECQLTILQLSESVFELDEMIREDDQRIGEFRVSQKRIIGIIEEQVRRGAKITTGTTAQEHELSVKKHEAVNLERQIENTTRSKAVKMNRRTQYLDTLRDLELAAGNLGITAPQNVDDVLRDAVEAMSRDVVASSQTDSKLEELGKTLGYVMQEIPNQPDYESVDAEFERLLMGLQREDSPLPNM